MQIGALWKKQHHPRPADQRADGRGDNVTSTPAQPDELEPMKRLTLDIPESLHRRIKARCAVDGVSMVEAIVDLLEGRFR